MDMMLILIRQIIQMFILAGIGFLLFKGKKISQEGSRTLGNILIYLVLPAVIINSFLVERTTEHLLGIAYSAAAALILLLMSILVSQFLFKKDPIAAFSSAFSNPGFFGIPLIVASLGQDAVFYVACFIAFLNIGQWTYGVAVMTGQPVREGFRIKKLIRAPFMIAIILGLLLFLTQVQLPSIVKGCLTTITGINTPLAMFTIGIYLAQTDLKRMLVRKALYLTSVVRLVVIPLLALLLLALLPETVHSMKMALLLAMACPVGSNVAVYAQLHGKDYAYAVENVVISTLFSILSIPAIVWVASVIW